MRLVPLALLLSAAPLFAQSHNLFSPDFPVSPCAPANSCQTFTDSELPSAAYRFYGMQLDMHWVEAHRPEFLKALETACRRHATCIATPGHPFWFCDDVLSQESRSICPRLFPGDQQCNFFLETYLLGIDIKGKSIWEPAQKCAAKSPLPQHSKPLEIWMSPSLLPPTSTAK